MEREAPQRTLKKWDLQDLRRNAAAADSRVTSVDGPALGDSAGKTRRDKSEADSGPPWPISAGVFIIQFFLPGIFVSHGVYLSHLLQQQTFAHPLQVVWPPAVFLAVWCTTKPIFGHFGFRHQGSDCKVLACCGTLILAIGLATSSLTHSTLIRTVTFGLIGGIGCSLATSSSEAQLALHFRPSVGLCLSGVAQSLGFFTAPLIQMALVSKYGCVGAPLVQASIALHGLVGALFFRRKFTKFKMNTRALQLRDDDQGEDVLYTRVSTESERGDQRTEMRSWKNPASDCVDGFESGSSLFDNDEDELENEVMRRPRNHMGVEIMPLILEEEEEEEVVFDAAQKRFSRIRLQQRDSWCPAAPLGLYSHDQLDSTVEGNSPMPLLTPSSPNGAATNVFTFDQSRCSVFKDFCLEFSRKAWSKITEMAKEIWHKSLIPTLLINVSQKLAYLGVAAIVPIVANQVVTYRKHEGAFSLAIAGFGWLCTTICTPCFLLPAAKRQKNIIASALYLISSVGFSLLSNPGSHDRLTLGCIVVGMTHGALINITPSLHHALWGSALIKNSVQTFLDIATAAIIIVAVSLAFYCAETVDEFGNVFLCLSYIHIAMGLGVLALAVFSRITSRYEVWELQRRQSVFA